MGVTVLPPTASLVAELPPTRLIGKGALVRPTPHEVRPRVLDVGHTVLAPATPCRTYDSAHRFAHLCVTAARACALLEASAASIRFSRSIICSRSRRCWPSSGNKGMRSRLPLAPGDDEVAVDLVLDALEVVHRLARQLERRAPGRAGARDVEDLADVAPEPVRRGLLPAGNGILVYDV